MNLTKLNFDRADDQASIFYNTLLDSLADGVLTIAPDHRIDVLNQTGASLLGLDPHAVVGRSLAEVFLADSSNDEFVDAILGAIAKRTTETIKVVVPYSRNDEKLRLAVVSTAYRVPLGSLSGQFGVVVTFNDVTEMLRLRSVEEQLAKELAEQHVTLQTAYVRLEEAAEREGVVSRRLGLIRMAAVAAVVLIFALVGYYNWQSVGPSVFVSSSSETAPANFLMVSTQPVISRIAVVGVIDVGSVVSVVAPFDGPVKQKFFEYGGAVERDRPLLMVDSAETQIKLRDAEGAQIKARQRFDELRDWGNSIDVSRARRTLATAEMERSNLAIRTQQTQMLLNKGIVPKDEYTQLQQQQYSQNMQLEAAAQDLTSTIEKGNSENRRLAQFDLLNAEAKMDDLKSDLARATVVAPVSGVVLLPPEPEGKRPDLLAVGSRVARGQMMFTIGDLETLSVRAKVDEVDVNNVRVGQQAIITGDAFDGLTLTGQVTAVAAQAAGESQTRSGMATFPVTVQIAKLATRERARLYVGMSATVSIISYNNPNAVVIPQSALKVLDGRRVVTLLTNGRSETIPVTLGVSMPDGIEVTQGLKAGDSIQAGQ